jgi:uncharacterized protein (DUF885 family)
LRLCSGPGNLWVCADGIRARSRLVVDTGIHDKNWTRQQVIDYMHANDLNDALAQTEADRYIAWPGQALAYKMGQLTIRKLRDEARAQLGPKFDIKAFHDEVINGGAMPLDLLQERLERWMKGQKPRDGELQPIEDTRPRNAERS